MSATDLREAVRTAAIIRAADHTERTIAALTQQLAEARHTADHDALTGLLNRSGLARAWDEVTPRGLLLLDLDGFKPVNDTYGHAAGDRVLQVIAARLGRLAGAVAARLGGDEFVLLATGADPIALAARAATVIAQPIALASGAVVSVTASIGVRPISPLAPVDLSTAMGQADEAMYRAKRAKGGDFPAVVWTPTSVDVTVREVAGLRLRDLRDIPRQRATASMIERVEPTTLCAVCGGYLAPVAGRLVHVEACSDCHDPADGVVHPCDGDGHTRCDSPEPAQCSHVGCHSDHSLVTTCSADREWCCGRCGCLAAYEDLDTA